MNDLSPPGLLFHYLRAFLGTRITALRESDDAARQRSNSPSSPRSSSPWPC